MSMKNEHIIFSIFPRTVGPGHVVICGLTDLGLEYLKANPGKTLVIEAPNGSQFPGVSHILVFASKSKEDLKQMLRATGLPTTEVT